MALDHAAHLLDLRGVGERFDVHHLLVHAAGEIAHLIENVCNASGHAGTEIPACRAEYDDVTTGHVLAAVIADRLDNRIRATVAHGETLSSHAPDVRLAAGRSIQADVADDDVLFRHEGGAFRREHDQLAARETLAEMVVGVAFEQERHAARHEGTEALPRGAFEVQSNGVLG